jgi:transposase
VSARTLCVGLVCGLLGATVLLIVDSTGLSIIGVGEWAAVKHGGLGKRAWKKLHLGVDRSGVIVAAVLTDGNAGDARTALDLVDKVEGDVVSFTADAAYDAIAIYEAAAALPIHAPTPVADDSPRGVPLLRPQSELANRLCLLPDRWINASPSAAPANLR